MKIKWLMVLTAGLFAFLRDGSPAMSADTASSSVIRTATLEEAIQNGLNRSDNLQVLLYTMEALDQQKNGVQEQIRQLDSANAGPLLPVDPAIIAARMPNDGSLSDEQWTQAILTQVQINTSLNALMTSQYAQTAEQNRKQRSELVILIHQLSTSQVKTAYQMQVEREGIKLMLTREYAAIQTYETELHQVNEELQLLQRNLTRQEVLKAHGFVDQTVVDKAESELTLKSAEKSILQQAHDLLWRQFCFQMNWTPESVRLEKIKFSDILPQPPDSFESLIKQSYPYMTAEQDLRSAEYAESQTSASDIYLKRQREAERKAAKEQVEQTFNDLYAKAVNIYLDAEKSYEEIHRLENILKDAQREDSGADKKLMLGMMTPFDKEKSGLAVIQAQAQLEKAKIVYFVEQAAIQALNKGYL